MTDLEMLQRGTINALREQLVQQAEKPCATCAAKDQTIALLADLVDWHRAQGVLSVPAAAPSLVGHVPAIEPTFAAPGELWASDEEELIYSALESGEMTSEQGEKALAHLQAQNTVLQVVK